MKSIEDLEDRVKFLEYIMKKYLFLGETTLNVYDQAVSMWEKKDKEARQWTKEWGEYEIVEGED